MQTPDLTFQVGSYSDCSMVHGSILLPIIFLCFGRWWRDLDLWEGVFLEFLADFTGFLKKNHPRNCHVPLTSLFFFLPRFITTCVYHTSTDT